MKPFGTKAQQTKKDEKPEKNRFVGRVYDPQRIRIRAPMAIAAL